MRDGQKAKLPFRRSLTIPKQRRKELELFEKQAGLRFRSRELLNLALCHRSFANETAIDPTASGVPRGENNEKLEFLGDAVLGLTVSEMLFADLPDRTEGEMARIKSVVVSEASLARIAQTLGIHRYILIGKGEERSGGRSKRAILADAAEAVIGALYLDGGLEAARRFVRRVLEPEIRAVLENRYQKDFKTLLQELVQKHYKSCPRYSLVRKSGPDHDRTFHVRVMVEKTEYGHGIGKTKKEAEQNAAEQAYRALGGEPPAGPCDAAESTGESRSR